MMEFSGLPLEEGSTALPNSPSSSSLSSATGLSDSLRDLHESPGTTPGTGSENGDPFSFGDAHHHAQLPPAAQDEYILVTGGLGYIGSHTTLELMKQGYNVVVVDNLTNCFASTRWRIQHLATQHCEAEGRPTPQLHFHKLDYQSSAMRLLLEQYSSCPFESDDAASMHSDRPPSSRITGVIHFAAYKSVEESIRDPLGYYDNNVCGLVSFIRLLGEFNIRNFIFSSSATIYGSKANAERPLDEDDVLHYPKQDGDSPGSVIEPNVEGLTCAYARSKYFCEAILADVARADPSWRITALRYFNPVGCDPSGLLGESPRNRPTNLFPVVAEVLSGKRPALSVFGQDWPTRDGTAIRDYIHVADIARGHVAALWPRQGAAAADSDNNRKQQGTTPSFRTYNLGSGTGTSVLEIVESLSKAAQRPVPIEWTGRRPGDVGICIASNTRASEELGWKPRETIAQSARDLWNYIRKMSHNLKPAAPTPTTACGGGGATARVGGDDAQTSED